MWSKNIGKGRRYKLKWGEKKEEIREMIKKSGKPIDISRNTGEENMM